MKVNSYAEEAELQTKIC